ncbi:MAG: hypothetical protein R3343_03910 [Nitriliruptorales bacterium]|nr:hypothetical protein [Nitriliruptorales bacterium]
MTDQPNVDLDDLRRSLEQLDEIPLDERAELFERCHTALVAELERLEEVS